MKSIFYSQPLSVQWAAYQKASKRNHDTVEHYFQKKNRVILTDPNLTPKERQIEAFILDLWAADTNKVFLHLYFVDATLRTFLEGIQLPDLSGILEFIRDNGFTSTQQALLPNGTPIEISKEGITALPFGIHVPGEAREKGYAFNLILNDDAEAVLIWAIGNDKGWLPLKEFPELEQDDSAEMSGVKQIVQLAVNTIAYMNAFPTCVVDGVPEEIKKRDIHSVNSRMLSISGKVRESLESADGGVVVTPHFRRGHFRHLKAERFTKLKGKIIFVHETMVKGRAKTVYVTDNIDKMHEGDQHN
jgi:hypothetical protein